MKEIKGTRTEKNLLTAFAGESQARNRYSYAASKAKKENYIKISMVFGEIAEQEKEHAKRLFKFLKGGEVEISAAFPAGFTGTTAENLRMAADGEKHEWGSMYPDFAKVAREEGFEDIAKVFEAISVAEKHHEDRYRKLLTDVENGTVFKRPEPTVWRCINCGYLETATDAPEVCPACAHGRMYFEPLSRA